MNLTIKTLTGKTMTINVDKTDTVQDLKKYNKLKAFQETNRD
jgi:hypothetical protein